MAEKVYKTEQYRLRAGSPMPTQNQGEFVLHTFMAEKTAVDVVACTNSLPGSNEFRGQGGNYTSANFSRLNAKGGNVFSGKIVYQPTFVNEDDI